ncbi:MAG: RNA polymerase factor sigma-54 [Planctomycetota bacterium]|jgi:RNA polymerase sigma-54 factor
MSQFLSQSLSQQMRLEQRLTPQLIQSMNILQKPVADLEAHVNEALETNAALEVAEPEQAPAVDGQPPAGSVEGGAEHQTNEESFQRLDRMSRDYDLGYDNRPPHLARRVTDSGERDAKLAALANTAGREVSMQEFLLEQVALLEIDGELRRACEVLIGHLDQDGYLRTRFEEIIEKTRPAVSEELLQRALIRVQRLEPTGVGARDFVECLLLQLDALPGDNSVERLLIERHLHDIAKNLLPAVSKATGFSIGEITEALKVMKSKLVLHPGFLVGDRGEPPIRPDVIIEYAETGGGLTVRLTRGNTPMLRISDEVAAMAKAKANGKDAREFARQQVESATALIDAVNFRHNRLLEVARAIVEKQREFFDVGPDGLKALRMSELALELNCDPSTISRTVADKYMQTPRGIYPLRYFFTGGTQTDDGETVGWDRIKTQVKELVDNEDGANPLKDDEIVTRLKDKGVDISRRTVAKYRQQLGIPNARRRQEY